MDDAYNKNELTDRLIKLGVEPYDLRQGFYKYRTIEEAIEIIQSNTIYFANATQFKDKFELRPSILDIRFTPELKNKYLDRIFSIANIEKVDTSIEDLTKFMLNRINKLRQEVGIFCTAKKPNSKHLWKEYGSQKEGVCLGFKVPDNEFLNLLSLSVNYTNRPKKIQFIDTNTGELTKDFLYWFCTKKKLYSPEIEVRIISESYFGPIQFPKSILYEIIFGIATKNENQNKIIQLLKQHNYPVQRFGKIVLDSKYRYKVTYINTR